MADLIERRSSFASPDEWMINFFGGGVETDSGITVSEDTALNCMAVASCITLIAGTGASLPLHVYKRLPNGGKERAFNHSLYSKLHDVANSEMTAYQLRETRLGHLATWGNAYSYINWNGAGQVEEIWPLRPDLMIVERVGGKLTYKYNMLSGKKYVWPAWRIWHTRWFSRDGIIGMTPIALAREGIGLALATEKFGGKYFGAGTQLPGVVEYPGKLKDPKKFIDGWNAMRKALSKNQLLMILEEGMSFKDVGIKPEDAQFLQTRRFQDVKIAGFYHVPPHLIGELEHATYTNIEEQQIEWVINLGAFWLCREEQEARRCLLTETERQTYFIEHNMEGLLRGNTAARFAAYQTAWQNSWMNADQILAKENMNPLPDGQGKKYWAPLNFAPIDDPARSLQPRQEGRADTEVSECR